MTDIITAIKKCKKHKDREMMIFDWDKAATLIKDQKLYTVYAGLNEDWEYTSGPILINGIIPDSYTFLASIWDIPVLQYDDCIIECYKMQSEEPQWDASTFWPKSARKILDPFLLSEMR